MSYALSWSGGKDSTLALDRALRGGLPVTCLFNIYEGSSGRVRFHGVRRELIAAQADALELDLVQKATGAADFEAVFLAILEELGERGIEGVVFGNIHLQEIRDWYEERTRAHGLAHVEPLWGDRPADLVREFRRRGYRACLVSVDLDRGDPAWIGRDLDDALVSDLIRREDVDPCGERGEYHTFVFDGPLFHRPVRIRRGRTVEIENHRLIDLLPIEAED